jgi:glycosyltransferase involved in cell wall biosynthesis
VEPQMEGSPTTTIVRRDIAKEKYGDIGVLALVPDPWNDFWMPRHQFLSRIARYFTTVWVDLPRDWSWILRNLDYRGRVSRDPSGLLIYRHSAFLPVIYRPKYLSDVLRDTRWARARNLLRREGCTRIILYIWRPEFVDALAAVQHEFSVYHIDDEYSFMSQEVPLSNEEESLIRQCDEVLIHSSKLMERKGHINKNSYVTPNGVDYQLFAKATDEPKDLRNVPRPRVGYVGIIKTQLDLALLDGLAQKQKNWSFVCVGPLGFMGEDMDWIKRLQARSNVYFLGAKQLMDLPAYMQHIDVCLMNYKIDAYTNNIYPLKLHEYLAAGTPVVSSRIRTAMDFESVIGLASTLEEWEAEIQSALAPEMRSQTMIDERRTIAKRHDWDVIVDHTVSRWVKKLLGSKGSRDRGKGHPLDRQHSLRDHTSSGG